MIQKIINFLKAVPGAIWKHKIRSSVALIILIVAVYYGYNYFFTKTETETRYILTSVSKGTITTTVSGTGQVESADEKTVNAEASGEITYLNSNVKVGETITKGTLIASIDNTDALKTISNDKTTIENKEDSLETAKMTLDDLVGTDESNPTVKQDAQDDLEKAYEDGYNTVSSAFLDLPTIMKDLDNILYGNTYTTYQDNIDYYTYGAYPYDESALVYKTNAKDAYEKARAAYDTNFLNYKSSSIYSETATIDSLISESYATTKLVAQAIKDAINLVQFYEDTLTDHNIEIPNTADTHISSLSSSLNTANSDVSSLFSTTNTIESKKEAIEDSTDQIRTAKLSVKSAEQALQNAKDTLEDDQDALSDYSIYATMSGIISAVNIEKGDSVSSGTNVVTIITTSKIASITLSETDIVGIKVGNTATITFDAIENLEVQGTVSEVDASGSASSGVVSYGLEIAFDTDDDNVKAGMSVSAIIATNSKEDVLILPSTAVKENDNGTYYVQVLNDEYDLTNRSIAIKGVTSATPPTKKTITIGLADDTNTEITSGLEEGDQIVLRVSSSTTTSTTSSSSNKSSSNSSSILNTGGGMPSGGAGGPPGM